MNNFQLKVDLGLFPSTFDMLHAGLSVLSLILLCLLVITLTLLVIGLVRRKPAPAPAEAAKAPEPRVVVSTPPPAPAPAPEAKPQPAPKPVPAAPVPAVTLKEATPDAAVQLLGLLQQEARFLDFIEENIAAYSDADIGAAARVVHEGCHKVLHQNFKVAPVREEAENSRITLPAGFDASAVRLTGNIVGKPPFNGTLVHRGWRVTEVKLPKLAEGHNVNIIAAAEVEL